MKFIAIILLLSSTTAIAADQEACRKKLKQAHDLGVLYAFDWKLPKEPHVMAGSTYYQLGYDAKEGFAETVNCFLTGGSAAARCVNFDVKHWRTGKATDRFSNCRLKPL